MKSKKPWIAEGDQQLVAQLVAQLVIGAIVVLWFIITQGVMPCDVKFCGA
jgi:hypothetical protein